VLTAPTNNPDFAPFVQKAKDAKPDVLFIFVPGSTQATAMIKAIKDIRLREGGHQRRLDPRPRPDEKLPNMGDAPVGLVTAGNYSTAGARRPFLAAWTS
jgi:branched-chain amino acid transport system substrate-binding protein